MSVSQGISVENKEVKYQITPSALVYISFSFETRGTQNMCLNPYNDVEGIFGQTHQFDFQRAFNYMIRFKEKCTKITKRGFPFVIRHAFS